MHLSNTLKLAVLLLTLPFTLSDPQTEPRSISQVVSDANRLLAEGSYLEASRAYGEAIELDPKSYINYYKRATTYLSLGRHQSALDDFEAILRLNPGFKQAYWQRAKIYAKEGEFVRGNEELGKAQKRDEEGVELANALDMAQAAMGSASNAREGKRWDVCVDQATKALEVGPNSGQLREMRIECATELGDVESVYGDLSRLATLKPSTLSLPLRLSHMAYFLLNSPTATTHIKQCLFYDPDSKPCKKIHKLLRSLNKDTTKARNFVEGSSWRQAIQVLDGAEGLLNRFEKALNEATDDGYLAPQFRAKEKSQSRLELYALACKAAVGAGELKKDKGMKWCEETLVMDPENVDALVGKGERLLKEEKWDEAVRALEGAFEKSGRSSQDILNRLQKAQRLLKVSKQKDYYKVLGVPRDADQRTIKKAFRTKAKKAHPDVRGTEEQMAQLNEAYEVLSNAELRQRFDNGDDPNDPQQGGGHNPFAHHGGGGGMPFQFFQQQGFPGGHQGGQKMHFNWG